MSNYATDSDLATYKIFEHGVASFTSELTLPDKVNKRLKADCVNHLANNLDDFDSSKLNSAQWKETTVYAALAYFILPCWQF